MDNQEQHITFKPITDQDHPSFNLGINYDTFNTYWIGYAVVNGCKYIDEEDSYNAWIKLSTGKKNRWNDVTDSIHQTNYT